MDINQYNIYVTDTIELAKSITVHSIEIAEAINNGLIERGLIVDLDTPSSWKYYMHLNGEYHSTDPSPFIITSKDTLEEIEFTKENLAEHPATTYAFKRGSFEYNRLVSRHLESETLIRGIVSPVSYEDSINSENYKILDWDRDLVEENEFSLIDNIQKYTDAFFLNHHNKAYGLIDNLYLAANLGIYYLFLSKNILNIRLKNCLTNEAHSFHIWAYLSSYGRLDRWKNDLDLYQKHYLYRNIRSINDNAGQSIIFNDLVKVLLSRRSFPLYGYDLRHIIKDMPTALFPDVLSTRYRIDEELNITNFTNTQTVNELLDRTKYKARDNVLILDEAISETLWKMTKSSKDRVVTKVLEAEVVNEVENVPLLISDIAYNHWVYLSSKGLYNVGVEVEYRPANISVQISSLEALALYAYCGSLTLGLTLEVIPNIDSFRIKKETLPDIETLLALRSSRDISDQWVKDLLNNTVKITKVDSVVDFTEFCDQIRKNDFDERFKYCLFESLNGNSNAKLLTDTLWANARSTILNESYSDFFARLSIDQTAITKENSLELMDLIFLNVTGYDPNDLGVSLLLKSLVELLTFLSSYNIQIIENDTFSKILPVRWPLQRINIFGFFIEVNIDKINLKLVLMKYFTSVVYITDFIKLHVLEKIQVDVSIYNHYRVETIVDIIEHSLVSTSDRISIPLIQAQAL